MKRRLAIWLLIASVTAGVIFRCQDFIAPYEDGHRGSCAALFHIMAKNHLRHGLLTTGGVGVLNPDWAGKEFFQYYVHHPPGAILLATVGARLGGTNPSGLRLAFVPFSIGIVLLVHRLARRRGAATAAAAGAIAAVTPIGVYYGAFVNFEIPTLFFMLLALYLFLRYRQRGRRKDWWRSLGALAMAVYCDWIALGLPLCLLVLLPFRKRRMVRSVRGRPPYALAGTLFGVGVLVVVAVLVHYRVQLGRFGGSAPNASLAYYRDVTPLAADFDWGRYGDRMVEYLQQLYGWPVLLLAAAGLLFVLGRLAKRKLDDLDLAALATLAIGVANVLVFGNHAAGHDYYQLYLLPPVALFAALAFAFPAWSRSPTTLFARFRVLVLVILLAWQTFQSVHLLSDRHSYKLSALGETIRANVEPDSTVIMPSYYTVQVTAAADRYIATARTRQEFREQLERSRSFGKASKPVVYLIGPGEAELIAPELQALLDARTTKVVRGPFIAYEFDVMP